MYLAVPPTLSHVGNRLQLQPLNTDHQAIFVTASGPRPIDQPTAILFTGVILSALRIVQCQCCGIDKQYQAVVCTLAASGITLVSTILKANANFQDHACRRGLTAVLYPELKKEHSVAFAVIDKLGPDYVLVFDFVQSDYYDNYPSF